MIDRFARLIALLSLLLLIPQAAPAGASESPVLTLPTPRGETWRVIQGYNCGSHNGWGRLSFDLVNADGRTRGAPVYAAADGRFWYWGAGSGTLIISHGGGYYTMYTHMQSHIDLPRGAFIERGTWIGSVGNVGASYTVPHLHFTSFYGEGAYASYRRPLPLSFADGYDFPDQGVCNNHGGALVTAKGAALDQEPPTVTWGGAAARTWTAEADVEWTLEDSDVLGYSYAWDAEPTGDAPAVAASAGSAELNQPGKHTLFVRAWDRSENETLASYEVWYDPTPPTLNITRTTALTLSATTPVTLTWTPAADDLSGIKGYQIYAGPSEEGTSDWFVKDAQVSLGRLSAGRFYLRVRAQDTAGNFSEWATVSTVTLQE